jgi:serine/threonine-protein kinase
MIDRLIADRFRITELVAHRGPVTVYEGIDLDTGQRVIVKRIRAFLADNPDFVEHWRRQIGSVQALNDRGVPEILAYSASEGELLQVESPGPGLSLRHYIAGRNVLSFEEAFAVMRAITGVMTPIHRAGISHGALNPDSIYIQSDGELSAFVTDWELGEIVAATTEDHHLLPDGVARYLAPEQIGADAQPPTPTSDVYALALILYELLTGDHPFSVGTDDPVLARLSHVPIAPSRFNPEISPAVEQILLRALSRDPLSRPPHAGALATALRRAEATPVGTPSTVPAVVPQIIERASAPPRDRPTWVLPAMIAGALVALFLFSLLLLQIAREPTPPPVAVNAVPNLVGLPLDEAQLIARRDEFTVSVGGTQSGSGQAPDTILAQHPPAGSLPTANRVISVTIAAEPTPVALTFVPNLYAQRLEVSELLLAQAGLRLGTVREAHSDEVPSGLVMEQNPRADLQVPTGTQVDVILSLGLPPGATTDEAQQSSPVPYPEPSPTVEPYPEAYPGVEAIPTVPETRAPTASPSPEATGAARTLLFQDDFSTNDAGWTTVNTAEFQGAVSDGRYQIVIYAPDSLWWTQAGREFDDFRYEADVIWTEPQEEGQTIGLVFRMRDADHFYLFDIDQFGSYRVRMRDGADWTILVEDTVPGSIRSGLVSNRLAVEAIGDSLRFEANGELLAEFQNSAYLEGDFGLAAVNEGLTTLTAEFDNVRLSAP